MDSREVTDLVKAGETLTVEFKLGRIDQDELAAAVICLANSNGGDLLLGVSDNGEVTGINPDKMEYADPQRLAATISTRTEPAVITQPEIIEVGDKLVAVVKVTASDTVHATSKGRYLRRSIDVKGEPQCLPMRPHEVLARASGAFDFSQRVADGLTRDDLDSRELIHMRELASQGGDGALRSLSDNELLQALNLADLHGRLTIGSVLLFGKAEAIHRYVALRVLGRCEGFEERPVGFACV